MHYTYLIYKLFTIRRHPMSHEMAAQDLIIIAPDPAPLFARTE